LNDASIALQVSTWVNDRCWRHRSSVAVSLRSSYATATAVARASSYTAAIATGIACIAMLVFEQAMQQAMLVSAAARVAARSRNFATAGWSSATTVATSRFAAAARCSATSRSAS
jgi:hypothetical protein